MTVRHAGHRSRRAAAETKPNPVRPAAPRSTSAAASGWPSFAKAAFGGRALWIAIALAAVTVAVYGPVGDHGFVDLDDPAYLAENPQVSSGLTWHGVRWAFTTLHEANWHPITWLSHMLDIQLFGMNPGWHHLTSLCMHIINTLLLLGLLHATTGMLARSAFVAAMFAVHPLHVESVAWAAERKDVLSTLFWMLTLWAYVVYVRQPRLRRYFAMLALFALGLMAKPMLVTLPFVLLLLDVWPLRRLPLTAAGSEVAQPPKTPEGRSMALTLVMEKLPLFVLSAASSVVTYTAQQHGGALQSFDKFPLSLRTENALVSYVGYITKMLWPAGLAVIYPFPNRLPAWSVITSALLLIGISAVVIRLSRQHPCLPVGWLWFLGTLVPVIGLVQVGGQALADRYTYVPLIGLFIIAAWGIPDLLARWRFRGSILPAAAALLIWACAIVAWRQIHYWKDTMSLWSHAVEVTGDNYLARNNLASALAKQGNAAAAAAQYREVLRLRPDLEAAHNNMGVVLANLGSVNEAIVQYQEALRLKPGYVDAHNNLGVALATQGRLDEAIQHFSEAKRLNPANAEAHSNLGFVLAKQGNTRAAIIEFNEALRINSDSPAVRRALDNLVSQGSAAADAIR